MVKINSIEKQDQKIKINNFNEAITSYSKEEAKNEANRCLQCKDAPCINGCPAKMKIPQFIKLISIDKFYDAKLKINETHIFPSLCGRVCAHYLQCERMCKLSKVNKPIAIGKLEKFIGDMFCHNYKKIEVNTHNKKIAIVGAGPAGLTTAHEMIKHGFIVTIFEKSKEIGGIPFYEIPFFRLPKNIFQAELEYIKTLKLNIITECKIGNDLTIDDLFNKYKVNAVFIGTGCYSTNLFNFNEIKGMNYFGVYTSSKYLTEINSKILKNDFSDSQNIINSTVVIGGGNTAIDVARTAVRFGVDVKILYRKGIDDMKAYKKEIQASVNEGINFEFFTNPTEILSDNLGNTIGIRCTRTKIINGVLKTITNSTFDINCKIVVVATGNQYDSILEKTTKDLIFHSGKIFSQSSDGRTSKKFVYAAGDVLTGPTTVINAISTAKIACKSILEDME